MQTSQFLWALLLSAVEGQGRVDGHKGLMQSNILWLKWPWVFESNENPMEKGRNLENLSHDFFCVWYIECNWSIWGRVESLHVNILSSKVKSITANYVAALRFKPGSNSRGCFFSTMLKCRNRVLNNKWERVFKPNYLG